MDEEATERAYAELASSILDPEHRIVYQTDDLEALDRAVSLCLQYNHIEPGTVPNEIRKPEERIDYLCRPSGTMYRTVRLENDWYKRSFGVMLGKLHDGTPAAIIPQWGLGYSYIDPNTGRKVRINKTTARDLEPEAVFFYHPLPAKALTIRDLAEYIFSLFDKEDYLLVILAALAATLMGLLPAWVNQLAYGTVIPTGQTGLILPITLLLLGVSLSRLLINLSRNLIMSRISIKLHVYTESAAYARVLMLPTSFFGKYASGNLAKRIMMMGRLADQITGFIFGAGLTFLLSFIYLFQIARYASSLTWAAFLTLFFQALFTILSSLLISRYEKETMDANASVSGTVTGILHGIQKIKLAGAEDRAFAKWAHGYAGYARAAYNRPNILRALPACVNLIGMLGGIALFYAAGKAQLTVADYMAFSAAYGQMSAAIMSLANLAAQTVQIRPMLEMTAPIMESAPELVPDKVMVSGLNGGIEVSNVSFRYDEDGPYVLQDLSFTIRPGEYVAFVGRSGCGKSTIMRLLLGFEKPETGSIFYGSAAYDVQNVDLRSLRRHIGTVMQNSRLFSADIYSNIILASPSSTVDDAWKAAEMAGIAEDIRKMPMGMNTILSEGSGSISGGQKQRLMIARAVCGERKILILDEATSALDNITQKHVTDALETLKCTRIVVAHRLSTVQHCDRILVIDGGKVAEEGSYEELIARNGLFAELVSRQRLDNGC